MEEEIKFRHTMPVQIRFSDVDQFGHVNNRFIFLYMIWQRQLI